jgi:5-methylcytosine-specific restriction enzyme subunit McrC
MLAICELILRRSMPTQIAGTSTSTLLDDEEMTRHRIFEKFVANFCELYLSSWVVRRQVRWQWRSATAHDLLPALIPDLYLEHRHSDRTIVLDTKFTPHSIVTGQFGNRTFNRDHLFQIYAYLRSQESHFARMSNAVGLLLYPTASEALSESVHIDGHEVRWESINLNAPWPDIERRLLELFQVRAQEPVVSSA